MKSSGEELKKRGFVGNEELILYQNRSLHQLIDMIHSKVPFERTAAVMLLRNFDIANDEQYIRLLLTRLSIEKSLYTKLEIGKTLEAGTAGTAGIMCEYLGKIGTNQHRIVPRQISKKKSYPLPRDIVARSLGRMNQSVLPVLLKQLDKDDRTMISELIDAIGFMIFYNTELASFDCFKIIRRTYDRYATDDLIVWKVVLCCSAFRMEESEKLLEEILKVTVNRTIIDEADKSRKYIKSRKDDRVIASL